MEISFNQAIEDFLLYLKAEKQMSLNTVEAYRRDLEHFARFVQERWDKLDPGKMDSWKLRRFLGWLNSQGMAKTSINRKLAAIRSFYRYLLREGKIACNPASSLKGLKRPHLLPRFLNLKEVERLLDRPPLTPLGLRDKALWETLYASGMRVGELVSLNLDHIDLKAGYARVWTKGKKEDRASGTKSRGGPQGLPGKGASPAGLLFLPPGRKGPFPQPPGQADHRQGGKG
ncbi:MAG TPA: hypothetical protein ENM97_03435 [Moorella mulderi]|nr:hypothetical protein [Moorella mulderi]